MTATHTALTGFGPTGAAATGVVAGDLEIVVARTGRITSPAHTRHRGVLRLMQPLYLDDSGQLTYMIVNPGGAYFGERYRLAVDVGPSAHLLVTSQGATRIYRTPHEPAQHAATFTLRSGSRFEYLPDQTIAYRDADFRQTTMVRAAPDAQAFFGEIVTPGWDPDGKRFTYAGLHLRVEVVTESDGRPVYIDNVLLQPAVIGGAIDGIGYLEGASHMGSVLILGDHLTAASADRVHDTVNELVLAKVGVTFGTQHGVSWLLVRALAASTDQLRTMIFAVNGLDRAATSGQPHLDLRRY